MLKVKSVTLGPVKYGTDVETVITFQVGPQAYNTMTITLSHEATRELVNLAIAKATAQFTIASDGITVAGEPLPMVEEAPEFAEVDEPAPLIAPSTPAEWMEPEASPTPEFKPEEQF